MAALLKERARKPLISPEVGISMPNLKTIDGVTYYVAEIREPWAQDGYDTFQLLLTEKEMLVIVSEWMTYLAKASR